jgi:SAM-dependent MidA family methyltransferase
MDAALYDPADGYYTTRARIGWEGGDYFTSADLGPAFGLALARAIGELQASLHAPATWDLVEAGAGRGTVMRDVLATLERERPAASRGVRPGIVEISAHLRARQEASLAGRGVRWAASVSALAPIHGVVFANELLDAFPVHVLVRTEDGVREAWVDERDGALVEVLGEVSAPELERRVPTSLPAGGRWEASPAAERWIASVAAALSSGYVLLIDYGGDEADLLDRHGAGTVRGFTSHRLVEDVLADPGASDLTASVNFTAIGRVAEAAGLRLAASGTQRELLLAVGDRERMARPASDLERLRGASRRSAVDVLTDPHGLGGFRVVCYAKDAPTDLRRLFERAP